MGLRRSKWKYFFRHFLDQSDFPRFLAHMCAKIQAQSELYSLIVALQDRSHPNRCDVFVEKKRLINKTCELGRFVVPIGLFHILEL